jgi:hypothetical protein
MSTPHTAASAAKSPRLRFSRENGDWKLFRSRFTLEPTDEIDLHFGRRDPWTPYGHVMADVRRLVEQSLKTAQENGRPYVMFIHGSSTSRRGKMTARSVVREFMRSPDATPFVDRKGCIQHQTVFLAKIRQVGGQI